MRYKKLLIYHYSEKDTSNRNHFLDFLVFKILAKLDYVFTIIDKHSLNLSNFLNVRHFSLCPKKSNFGGVALS